MATTALDLTAAKARLSSLMATSSTPVLKPIMATPSASAASSASTTATSSVQDSVSSIQAAMSGNSVASGLTAVTGPDGSTLGILGDPTSLQAPATTPAPPPAPSNTSSTLGIIGGVASLASLAIKTGLIHIASDALSFGLQEGFAILGVGLAAYTMFDTLSDMFKNGFSWSSLGKLGMAVLSAGISFISMGIPAPLAFVAAGILTAAMAIAAFIASLFGSHPNTTPSAEEKPLIAFPSVWTSGPALYMTSGLALMTMGFNLTPTAPLYQSIAVPTVNMTTALNNSGLQDANGNSVSNYSKYGTLFVDKGDGTAADPDKVMIVSPGSNGTDNVSVYTIKSNLQFTSPQNPGDAYIPMLISDGKGNMVPNPQAVQAIQNENALTDAANALSGSAGVSALKNAGTTDKAGTASSGSH